MVEGIGVVRGVGEAEEERRERGGKKGEEGKGVGNKEDFNYLCRDEKTIANRK